MKKGYPLSSFFFTMFTIIYCNTAMYKCKNVCIRKYKKFGMFPNIQFSKLLGLPSLFIKPIIIFSNLVLLLRVSKSATMVQREHKVICKVMKYVHDVVGTASTARSCCLLLIYLNL